MKEKKFKTFFLVSSVILVLVGMLFLLLSMTEPSSGWRLYHDDRWNFSLEYPAEWSQRIPVENYNVPDHVIKRMVLFDGPQGPAICLHVFTVSEPESVMEWFHQTYRHLISEEAVIPELPNTMVNDYPALTIENPQHMSCDLRHTFVKIHSMVFEFQYRGSDGFASMDIYNHMLSSFRYEGGNDL